MKTVAASLPRDSTVRAVPTALRLGEKVFFNNLPTKLMISKEPVGGFWISYKFVDLPIISLKVKLKAPGQENETFTTEMRRTRFLYHVVCQ